MQQQQELPMVVSPDEMDDDTFIKHFNARHADQLPGITSIIPCIDPGTLHTYRIFHDKLHEWSKPTMELPHEHRASYEHGS